MFTIDTFGTTPRYVFKVGEANHDLTDEIQNLLDNLVAKQVKSEMWSYYHNIDELKDTAKAYFNLVDDIKLSLKKLGEI